MEKTQFLLYYYGINSIILYKLQYYSIHVFCSSLQRTDSPICIYHYHPSIYLYVCQEKTLRSDSLMSPNGSRCLKEKEEKVLVELDPSLILRTLHTHKNIQMSGRKNFIFVCIFWTVYCGPLKWSLLTPTHQIECTDRPIIIIVFS